MSKLSNSGVSGLPQELLLEICQIALDSDDFNFFEESAADSTMPRAGPDGHTERHDRLLVFRNIAPVCKAWLVHARIAFWNQFIFAASDDLPRLLSALAHPTARPDCITLVKSYTYDCAASVESATSTVTVRQTADLCSYLPSILYALPQSLEEFIMKPDRTSLGQSFHLFFEAEDFGKGPWARTCDTVDISPTFVPTRRSILSHLKGVKDLSYMLAEEEDPSIFNPADVSDWQLAKLSITLVPA